VGLDEGWGGHDRLVSTVIRSAVAPDAQSESALALATSPVAEGIVPRPALFERIATSGRVTQVSAPAGSGKTVLLRSWIREAGLGESVAWVSVQPAESDAQRFWLSVLDALRGTAAGSALVRELTPAPDLDWWAMLERLLEDLGALEGRLWLVIDDLHELCSGEALRQLELLLMRAPPELRFVLVTRHDLQLGLHRLRLEGGLTEIRAADLRFMLADARELFEAARMDLSDSALELLVERTEGWAAGLRLAALSLAGHPDQERFAAEFSGSERTVAEYLLAEVLERQPEEVRRLLLRTSVLDRVSGPLADVLTGGSAGERILHELEAANAFVISLDAGRSWFRYHHLFGDLLQLELRRTEPGELPALHCAAAEWFAEHGHPVDAVRHAQAAEDWGRAARLFCDHWVALYLAGRTATAHQLLSGFPAAFIASDPELAVLTAGDELSRGSLEEAERNLALAERGSPSVAPDRRERFQITLAIVRLSLARQRGDLPTVVEEAQRLLAPAETQDAAQLELGEDLRALALISLGIAETWARRHKEAERDLDRGVALARRIERPYLELLGLAHSARTSLTRSYALGARRGMQAIELARRHGWTEEPIVGVAYAQLAGAMVAQGQLDEAERWLDHGDRTLRAELEPAAGMTLHWARGGLEMARGRPGRALDSFQAAERLAELLLTSLVDAAPMRAQALQALVRMGETDRVRAALAELDEQERDTVFVRSVTAALRIADRDPEGATRALAPVIGSGAGHPIWSVGALLLEAIARDMLADAGGAERAIERALDLAEPDRMLFPFLLYPVRGLLERHTRHRTTHASLVAEILNLLMGKAAASALGEPERLREPLSESETRVLRYLPTNLSKQEIAGELYLSVNTVKTHIRHLYAKLDVSRRAEAVERARGLGLLAPAARGR
jgi:LuxR family transcriptional regulator, maltose regulon positive regulatory protein